MFQLQARGTSHVVSMHSSGASMASGWVELNRLPVSQMESTLGMAPPHGALIWGRFTCTMDIPLITYNIVRRSDFPLMSTMITAHERITASHVLCLVFREQYQLQ